MSTGSERRINVTFRRTARDAIPPRSVVTAAILGDPRPGRSALDQRQSTRGKQ